MLVSLDVAVPIIGSAFLALVGAAIFWSGVRQYRLQRSAVSRAERASGTIETVDIQRIQDGTESIYVPVVEYEYQTPTQRLRGTTVYPGRSRFTKRFQTESAARNAIEAYEPDAQTTVYYDPATPDHSFLDPEIQRGPTLAKMIFGAGLVALGGVLVWQSGLL